jgi:hypothetical protein
LKGIALLDLDEAAVTLTERLLDSGAVLRETLEDALPIAVATVDDVEIVVVARSDVGVPLAEQFRDLGRGPLDRRGRDRPAHDIVDSCPTASSSPKSAKDKRSGKSCNGRVGE